MVGDHHGVRDLDINQTPKTEDDREIMIGATSHVNEEDSNSGRRQRKKLRLTKEQSHLLEESFIKNNTLTPVSKFIYYTINGSVYIFVYVVKRKKKKREKRES